MQRLVNEQCDVFIRYWFCESCQGVRAKATTVCCLSGAHKENDLLASTEMDVQLLLRHVD
jgi:hypothetical protein